MRSRCALSATFVGLEDEGVGVVRTAGMGLRRDEPPCRLVPLGKARVALVGVLHAGQIEAIGDGERRGVDLRTADDEYLLVGR